MRGQAFLESFGILPWNPAFMPEGMPYESYFHVCFPTIDVCDAVLLLPDWQKSKGVLRELEYIRNAEKGYIILHFQKDETLTVSGNGSTAMEIGNMLFGHSRGKYPVERDLCEPLMTPLWDALPFPSPDCIEEYETDVFVVRPYYWGDKEEMARLPNFLHKPTGFELRWYKYPLRDAYVNQKIPLHKFRMIIDECVASIKKQKSKGEE